MSPGTSRHVCVVFAEGDDLKFDPFGTSAISTLASYDWSERDETLPGEHTKQQQGSDAAALPSLAPAPGSGPVFGSGENISNDATSADGKFEAFAHFGDKGGEDGEDDFGDFAGNFSEKSDSPAAAVTADECQSEASDEFGAFQGDKPKFGKSDFLKASAQANVKSSEEMIKNELATFDLSVQGKRVDFQRNKKEKKNFSKRLQSDMQPPDVTVSLAIKPLTFCIAPANTIPTVMCTQAVEHPTCKSNYCVHTTDDS